MPDNRRTVNLKCKTVVFREHTLGVVYPNDLQILRASILRGSPFDPVGLAPFDPILNHGEYRPATEQDFADYGVAFDPMYLEPVENIPTFVPEGHALDRQLV